MSASAIGQGGGEVSRNGKIETIQLALLRPAPENQDIYRAISETDPDVIALADSIRENGVLEPLVVSEDFYILSGHRRSVAARLAGLERVPVRFKPIRRTQNPREFRRLLRESNRQRVKTYDELTAEEAITIDPERAHETLRASRIEKSDMTDFSGIVDHRARYEDRERRRISSAKEPMLSAAMDILEAMRSFWPLSVRQVHYALLNNPPLRHAKKPGSRYANDERSYQNLCDLLTRARLFRRIPFDAIEDETRPVLTWDVHSSVQSYVGRELEGLFLSYWRDLQASQPQHIEVLCEKLTVRPIVKPVAREYVIPATFGRGYSSIDARWRLVERFKKSGKRSLVVLILSDCDPEGEDIATSFARSMERDFSIRADECTCVKVALRPDQAREMQLPTTMKAKKLSSRYKAYASEYGDDVYELEAIEPARLQAMLTDAIQQALDVEAFNAEVAKEQEDAAYLEVLRRRVLKALGWPEA